MERVIALNVEKISSFCLLYLMEVSALRMLSVRFALVIVTFMCCENVSFGSKMITKSFGVLLLVVFGCLSDGVVQYSAGSVKSVVVVLSVYTKIISVGPI